MRGEKNLPHMPEWKIRSSQDLPSFGYVRRRQMKLTIEGPDNHDFLQSIINGKYVSLKNWPGAKLFVGSAYDKYLEMKKASDNADL